MRGILYRCINEKQNDFATSLYYKIDSLFETKVIIKNIELQKDILNIMYVTGMDAIEIDNEDVIKITSNYLGWAGAGIGLPAANS